MSLQMTALPVRAALARVFARQMEHGRESDGLAVRSDIFVEGLFARFMYRASRLMHDRAVGTSDAVLSLVARALARHTGAPVKLHRCFRG